MQTRPLTKQDYDEIVSVLDAWWGGPSPVPAHPIFFYELGKLARVVEDEGQLVGFLFGFVTPDQLVGYVHLVGIHPDYRRRGVGGMLYSAFEADCRKARCRELKAITTSGNEASMRFHEAQGWVRSAVDDYAGPGRHRVVFKKPL